MRKCSNYIHLYFLPESVFEVYKIDYTILIKFLYHIFLGMVQCADLAKYLLWKIAVPIPILLPECQIGNFEAVWVQAAWSKARVLCDALSLVPLRQVFELCHNLGSFPATSAFLCSWHNGTVPTATPEMFYIMF